MKLRRWHLFEIEDLAICPGWVRDLMTSMIVVLHRWFGVSDVLATEIRELVDKQSADGPVTIIDLCSGFGGPMPDVLERLRSSGGEPTDAVAQYRMVLTDLYPSANVAANLANAESNLHYDPQPVDARNVDHAAILEAARIESTQDGLLLRTMVCSFHHMRPKQALAILEDAQKQAQPIVIFELSDGSRPPARLWWVALIPNFFFGVVVSLFARPMTAARIVFSFLLPIIPACFAWDGAVSVARTYGQQDFETLLSELPSDETYKWAFRSVPRKASTFSVIVGQPTKS